MDTKALAKSKRAHSLRHTKKHNLHQVSKVPSISSGTATGSKKPTSKQVGENLQKSHGSRTLPSNWDRYDEEFDFGTEDPAGESTSQPTEFVVPKSKGADYAYLILEAKAQQQLNYSSDIFPSFNDGLDDFTQGFGPMLSARGQSILSWIAEDDFDFEDKASTSYEAPFLSLNLHALAEQLEKAKLSERLFLAPDVLPPELLNDELQACGKDEQDQDHDQTCASAVEIDSEESSLSRDLEENKNAQHYRELIPPATIITRDNPVVTAKEGLHSTNQIKDDLWELLEIEQKPNVDSAARKPATFEAANVEAELDMLLNSFTETKFLERSNAAKKSNNGSEIFTVEMPTISAIGISSIPFASASAEIQKKGTDTKKPPMKSANIDDAIDNLLEETSNLVNLDGGSLSHELKAFPNDIQSNLNPVSKSNLLDDFDSWLDTI